MTSDFRHSFASEEEWAVLEPVLEDGFPPFFRTRFSYHFS